MQKLKHQEITVTVDKNCTFDIDPERPTLKPGHTVTWACDDECVVVFDGYNDDDMHGKKHHKGPLGSKQRIVEVGKKVKVGPHYYDTGTGKEPIPYKYTIIVCHDGKLCTRDPEIIVDPDPHPAGRGPR